MLHFVIGTYSLRFEKQKLREKYFFYWFQSLHVNLKY